MILQVGAFYRKKTHFRLENDGDVAEKELKVANCFGGYFSSIGNILASHIQKSNASLFSFISNFISISILFVEFLSNYARISSIINFWKRSSATEVDGISLHMLLHCPNIIVPLTYMCNRFCLVVLPWTAQSS